LLAVQDTPDISFDGLDDLLADRQRGESKALELSRLVPLATAEQGLPSVLPDRPAGVNGQNGPGDVLAFVGSQEDERI